MKIYRLSVKLNCQEIIYSNLESLEQACELYLLLKYEEKKIENYEGEYKPNFCGRPKFIIENIFENGTLVRSEKIHHLSKNLFVRNLHLCDIIKNWDYEPF